VTTARPAAPGGGPGNGAPVRDRATWIVYASLAIYGYALYGLGPALDALREELEVSRGAIGLAGSAFAMGSVVAALGSPPVLLRVGHGTILRGGLLGLGAGTVMLVVAGPLPTVIAATFVMGLAGTAVLVVVPLVVEDRQPAARAAALAEANMGAAAAGVLAPVAVGAAILAGAGWRAGALLVLAAIAAVILLGAADDFDGPPARDARPTATGPLPRGFWRWWTVIVLVVGVEFCVAFWATDFLQEEAGVGRGAASASLGLFVGGMATGRFVGGRLAVARDPRSLLIGALGVAAAGFVLFWSTGAPAVSLIGLAVIGLGVAMLFPLALSFAMASAPGVLEKASARASLAGGIAVLLAPYALATLADAIGVRAGFLLVPVLIAAALALTLRGGAEAMARRASAR
jgi:predicted MFS family arabinose efflux permease